MFWDVLITVYRRVVTLIERECGEILKVFTTYQQHRLELITLNLQMKGSVSEGKNTVRAMRVMAKRWYRRRPPPPSLHPQTFPP
jgi:hypothetical protein